LPLFSRRLESVKAAYDRMAQGEPGVEVDLGLTATQYGGGCDGAYSQQARC